MVFNTGCKVNFSDSTPALPELKSCLTSNTSISTTVENSEITLKNFELDSENKLEIPLKAVWEIHP